MNVFRDYANYYDALYREKDYKKECDFLEQIWEVSSEPISRVLDLGCGTGGHALPLAQRGYHVTGGNRSEQMLVHHVVSLPTIKQPTGIFWSRETCFAKLAEQVLLLHFQNGRLI